MTNDGVRGESGISYPDNIETKTAISAGVDVIHSSATIIVTHHPLPNREPGDHYYAPTTIMVHSIEIGVNNPEKIPKTVTRIKGSKYWSRWSHTSHLTLLQAILISPAPAGVERL